MFKIYVVASLIFNYLEDIFNVENKAIRVFSLNATIALWRQNLILSLLLLAGIAVVPQAHAEKFGDFEFNDSSIVDYTGVGGSVIIPSIINGSPVLRIGVGAFLDNSSITSVIIPDGVVSISDKAFKGCVKLTNAIIPESVQTIGMEAFYDCKSLSDIMIPDSIGALSGSVFYGCVSLTNVVIGNSVTSIGSSSFRGCTGLTTVVIGNSVTSIGSSSFRGCTGLTSVNIPSNVAAIGNNAFTGCTGLRNLIISNGVIRIGASFTGCTGLTDVIIPNSVTAIGSAAFYGCASLKRVVIGRGIISIGESAFAIKALNYVLFLGNAPDFIGVNAFYANQSFRAIYYNGRVGFSSPIWHGYLTEVREAPSVPALLKWREMYFGVGANNAGESADTSDPDGDGQTNLQEFVAGTHPKSSENVFQAKDIMKTASSYTIGVYAQPARRYFLQRLIMTSEATWQNVAAQESPLVASFVTLTDYSAPENAAIYRLLVALP